MANIIPFSPQQKVYHKEEKLEQLYTKDNFQSALSLWNQLMYKQVTFITPYLNVYGWEKSVALRSLRVSFIFLQKREH